MKRLLLSTFICLFTLSSFSQQTDSIIIVKTFDNLTFIKDGKTHKLNELSDLVAAYPKAVKYADKARTDNAFALIFSCFGGFMIGWPIGTYIGGGEPEWNLLAVGAGSLTIGLIFNSFVKKNAKKAVELYNENVCTPNINNIRSEFGIGLNERGIGLSFRF